MKGEIDPYLGGAARRHVCRHGGGTTLTSHAPEYSEYLAPSDDDIAPAEDQPLPASPIARSSGYIANSEPIEDDSEEDLEMDRVDYAADKEEEESFEDEEEEEKEEHDMLLCNVNLFITKF
uniref:Uncharacterized protein n=1 Tax=Tanacetum cinerariifolium TaxID=118510 RepID=A0A699HRI4_TANCI|nr:hypothetical protein [Tanacetum cinerariifolium]